MKRKGKDVLNRKELSDWLDEGRKHGHDFVASTGHVDDVYYELGLS